jgi:hypothetical protein
MFQTGQNQQVSDGAQYSRFTSRNRRDGPRLFKSWCIAVQVI